jgi:predicted HAD superfamily phosphohydrolase YqeG
VLCEEAGGDKDTGIPFEELKRRIVGPIVMIGDQPADASGSTLVGIPSVLVEHMPSNIEQSKALIRAIEAAIEILESE